MKVKYNAWCIVNKDRLISSEGCSAFFKKKFAKEALTHTDPQPDDKIVKCFITVKRKKK